MAGVPPKYAMQSSTGTYTMVTTAIPQVPVDVQLSELRRRVDQLTSELAEL